MSERLKTGRAGKAKPLFTNSDMSGVLRTGSLRIELKITEIIKQCGNTLFVIDLRCFKYLKKAIKTLAKEMEMDSVSSYFDYLIETFINGNFSSCRKLFKEMRKSDQKAFILYMEDWRSDVKEAKYFYFKLL